jgi:hypothetical protein
MAEEKEVLEPVPSVLADGLKRQVLAVQDYAKLSFESIANAFTPPFYWADTLEQMDVIGVG